MPRQRIPIPDHVEHLSIVDLDGRADPELEPRIDDAELMRYYRALLRSRRLDERMILLSRQGRIGNYPPFRGQEAASLGPALAMSDDDWLVPAFRELPALLQRGWPMDKLILGWWGGHEYGASPPKGVRALPLASPVASQCPHAAGLAMGCKLRKTRDVVVCFLGDGGTSEGDFHEAMNFAGVYRLPLVMVVHNNQWAISTPFSRQTASPTIAQKAIAYGVAGLMVDGNDLLAMVVAAREAIDRARCDGGATLIEALTYRVGPHSTSDDPKRYRVQADVDAWLPRDPLIRFRRYLEARGLIDDALDAMIDEEIAGEIAKAVQRALAFEPDPAEPFFHCLGEVTPDLWRQFSEFQRHLRAPGAPAPHRDPAIVCDDATSRRPTTPVASRDRTPAAGILATADTPPA